jgi:hypothetical protein
VDRLWRLRATVVVAGSLVVAPLALGGTVAEARAQDASHRLAVYYAVPSDVPFDQDVLDTLKSASRDIRAWYQIASGGVTWQFTSPKVVEVYAAQKPRRYYLDNGNWWASLPAEMGRAGLPIQSPGTVTAIWAHGAGWWAGAIQSCDVDCGLALLGVELFPQFNDPAFSGGNCPDPDGLGGEAFPCTPRGAFAHELGHTLGLPHPVDVPATRDVAFHSIMQTHWNYPDQAAPAERPWGFLRDERQALRANSFMHKNVSLAQPFTDVEIVNLTASGKAPSVKLSSKATKGGMRFTNRTTGANLYYWTFGDGRVSNATSPVHAYPVGGTYTATLWASSPTSMMATATLAVTAKPDLDVTAVTVPAKVCAGTSPTFRAGIRNTGSAGSGMFTVRWKADGQVFQRNHKSIAAGASDRDAYTWRNVPRGRHKLMLDADARNRVSELDERNNSDTLTFVAVRCPG